MATNSAMGPKGLSKFGSVILRSAWGKITETVNSERQAFWAWCFRNQNPGVASRLACPGYYLRAQPFESAFIGVNQRLKSLRFMRNPVHRCSSEVKKTDRRITHQRIRRVMTDTAGRPGKSPEIPGSHRAVAIRFLS